MIDQYMKPSLRRGLAINDFCETYGIGRSKAYVEMAEGRLKAVKVGCRRIIRADDAEAWLASLQEQA